MTSQRVSSLSLPISAPSSWAKLICAGLGLSACMTLLTGCQHRSAATTTADWVHGIEGGEVYRLQPPAPGYGQPYPHIGRTPTTTPEFPSAEARTELTQQLEEQRNRAQRLSAASGPLQHTNRLNPLPPAPGNGNSMTMVSQNQGSSPPPPPLTHDAQGPGKGTTSSLTYQPIDHRVPARLPHVDNAPPPPLTFPGFQIPAAITTRVPDFDSRTPAGTLLLFQTDTDHLKDGQESRLNDLSTNRHDNIILIHGFGTALGDSSGLNPEDQRNGMALGLLRAKTVAQQLIARGVPAEKIELRADPIGDGVRVLYRLP
ncbi:MULTISPECIES: OmpA family protein [unclassified Saccharibacter]|uniref:OmpA family protein n=1 Tax=unclassified Saccharibacter TaxID=2648722 RepID=UPI00132B5563|nr:MULTISPECIES: hypothetical protein [unclassified Saccharibacter]MXV36892.1 hypothetical protein [Saccharibacter sp. EH611]MXV58618.1 hypothetical protein [Saccharibacter sp. EH70]MXV66124.1 hypothetical protein [Saccharibacter sp. EH60]